ncbi:MAG: 30S ribosomal protein S12 methylthiotransferase RimO [Desulfomonilaceae bacterium]
MSLGCPKNRVDSEKILFIMTSAGFVYAEDPAKAAILVVNTCAFIEPAVEESIDTIFDYRYEYKKAFLVVTGCLPLRYKQNLKKILPEVNLFLPPDKIQDLPMLLQCYITGKRTASQAPGRCATETDRKYSSGSDSRILTTPGYAYLKIAEGCSRSCRYCTIPSIRGPLHSFDSDSLKGEATYLAAQGVRELILVAQDLTAYGLDRREKKALVRLVRNLCMIENIKWIRLMYLYPDTIPSGLSELIQESGKVLPYLDIPIQHISVKVLKAMGRPWKGDRIKRMINRLRSEIPGLVLRTTLMVGYPAEGEKEFRELRDFVESTEIEKVGVFTYSPEEGTSAFEMGDPICTDLKKARAQEIRSIHSRFENKRNRSKIGKIEDALIEGVASESEFLLQARIWDQAPEVDGTLYITAGNAMAGEIHKVRITDSYGSDLFGEIIPLPSGIAALDPP